MTMVMNWFKVVLENLNIIIRPHYWLRNKSTNMVWDRRVNEFIKNPHFARMGDCIADIDNIEIWTENHPYASATYHGMVVYEEKIYNKQVMLYSGMPTRKTVYRFMKMYKKHKALFDVWEAL